MNSLRLIMTSYKEYLPYFHKHEGLSTYLTQNFGRGSSVGNLKNIRQFYRVYAQDRIGETVFSQSENYPATSKGFDR